jgi:RNA polymerase sigma factor (sigma-70 family)
MSLIPLCDLFRRCVDRRGGGEWQEFVRRCGRRVRSVVWLAFQRRGVEISASDLEELVQDVYCRLLTVQRFRGRTENELWKFLARVARNLAIDYQRAELAGKRRIRLVSLTHPDAPYERFVTLDADPEHRCLEGERWRVFLARCADASPRRRLAILRALRMALLEGWTSREIAARLGGTLSAGQIDGLICRLTRRLLAEGLAVPRRAGGWLPPPRAGDPGRGDQAPEDEPGAGCPPR